jgi:hypothetical protein
MAVFSRQNLIPQEYLGDTLHNTIALNLADENISSKFRKVSVSKKRQVLKHTAILLIQAVIDGRLSGLNDHNGQSNFPSNNQLFIFDSLLQSVRAVNRLSETDQINELKKIGIFGELSHRLEKMLASMEPSLIHDNLQKIGTYSQRESNGVYELKGNFFEQCRSICGKSFKDPLKKFESLQLCKLSPRVLAVQMVAACYLQNPQTYVDRHQVHSTELTFGSALELAESQYLVTTHNLENLKQFKENYIEAIIKLSLAYENLYN